MEECVDGYYGSFGFKFQLKEVKHLHTYSKFMYTHTYAGTHKQCEYQCEAQNKGSCEFGQVSVSEAGCMFVCVYRL